MLWLIYTYIEKCISQKCTKLNWSWIATVNVKEVSVKEAVRVFIIPAWFSIISVLLFLFILASCYVCVDAKQKILMKITRTITFTEESD